MDKEFKKGVLPFDLRVDGASVVEAGFDPYRVCPHTICFIPFLTERYILLTGLYE